MDIIDALHAYSQKQAGTLGVFRAILEHDAWQVPLEHFARGRKGPLVTPRLIMYGQQTIAPPGHLWLFTDDEHGRRAAASGRLGTFAAGVRGGEVLRHLDGYQRVDINPGSPKAETCFFEVDAGSSAFFERFSRAIALEKRLEAAPLEDPETLRALRRYDGYIVPGNADRTLVLARGQHGLGVAALAFTVPDRHEALGRDLPPETFAALTLADLTGGELFSLLAGARLDGVIINGFDPGARALPIDLCRKIAALDDSAP